MILPGISGSFLLILMGKYQQILDAVTDRDIATLGIFMIGAAIGLALFSRLLSWLFKHHHDLIISLLTGFLVGSLNKVWPWKRVLEYRTNSNGEIEPFLTKNILPVADDPLVLWAVGLCLLAVVVVITLEKLGSRQKQNTPGK
jgi:putative membrane protein